MAFLALWGLKGGEQSNYLLKLPTYPTSGHRETPRDSDANAQHDTGAQVLSLTFYMPGPHKCPEKGHHMCYMGLVPPSPEDTHDKMGVAKKEGARG